MSAGEVFAPVTVEWQGKQYVIPPNKILGLIGRIESIEVEGAGATIPELMATSRRRGTIKLSVLTAAWGAVLRYAGADVSDEQVYAGLFERNGSGAVETQTALLALMSIMLPPSSLADTEAVSKSKKSKPAARTASSRKRTS